jgi:hypothetical protein
MDIIQAFQMYWQEEGLEGVLMGRRTASGPEEESRMSGDGREKQPLVRKAADRRSSIRDLAEPPH